MIPNAACQACNWTGPADHCHDLKNAHERVEPGDIMPAGECPVCNASAMLIEEKPEPCMRVLTVSRPDDATHFGVRSTTQSLANIMWAVDNRHSYSVQDLDRHGFRVAVYKPAAHRKMTGQRPHPVYAQGMPRCSCSFCIFGSADDHARAARLRPDLYARYVALERRLDHTLSPSRRPLPEITGIDPDRQPVDTRPIRQRRTDPARRH